MNAIYPLLLPFGKFIVATGLLIGFYLLLYKRSASYNHSRLYLLAIPIMAALVSWVTIEVSTPPPRTVEIETLPALAEKASLTTKKSTIDPLTSPEENSSLPPSRKTIRNFNWKKGLWGTYFMVTGILLLYPLMGTIRILQLKKKCRRDRYRGISVLHSAKVKTPFSLFKTIYLNEKLRDAQLQMILAHERWHILHKHYMDVMCIEFLTRIFWFNPLLWWVRQELRNLHEYQVDRSVLDDGLNIYEYQTTLLEEVMNHSSCLANGFNQSFIKQRFITMKKKQSIRFSTLRTMTLIPFCLLIVVAFTFTKGEAKIIYIHKPAEKQREASSESVEETAQELRLQTELVPESSHMEAKNEESLLPSLPVTEEIEETILIPLESLLESTSLPTEIPVVQPASVSSTKIETLTQEDNLELLEITNRPDYPQLSKVSLSSIIFTSDIAECPIYIEREEDRTLVTRVFPIHSDWELMKFPDKNKIMLIDSRTGDRYLLRELQGGYPLGTPFYIRRHQKQMVQFTFTFPPLPSSVKTIDIIDGTNVYGLKIKEHIKKKIKVIR